MSELVIDAKNLSRHFGKLIAVRDVSLQVQQGQILWGHWGQRRWKVDHDSNALRHFEAHQWQRDGPLVTTSPKSLNR